MSSITQQGSTDAVHISVEPATVPEVRTPAASRRDPYFDNAKYLAILLVALGHILPVVVEGSRATRTLYMFVYFFHMPVFVLVSGYLSRSYTGRPDQLKRLLTGVALPYVVFEVVYTLLIQYGTGSDRPISLLHPSYLMWFLLALFLWRVTAPFWSVVRWPVAVSIAIAALATVTPGLGGALDLPRVLQFLPFFVIGLRMRPEQFRALRRRPVRVASAVFLAASLVVTYKVTHSIPLNWLYRSRSVQDLNAELVPGLMWAGLLFVFTLLLTAAFLSLVPGSHRWFTVLGAGTICGYLLHGILIRTGQYAGVFEELEWLNTPAGRVVTTLAMVAVMTLLCTPPVRKLMKPVTEPELAWAFRRAEKAGAERGRR
ncbi:acyltransferase family protein [Streptomyces sp. NBC_01077]|uniref:acyltransferase family protein n=1 Tax=Streptomyces sp. NBC_01077 TaxID=2903746 RepID=UPI00386945BA|nr:acyltransferase family protein [Streptomyces sp. NBC_01077]